MLTDGDRMQLSPHLAKMRAARLALAKATRTAEEAAKRVAEHRQNTGFLDRLFNRDDAYRGAQRALADAKEAVANRQRLVKSLDRSFDPLVQPMMPRLDRGYEAGTIVIESCAHAAQECRAARHPIESMLATAGRAIQNGGDDRTRKDAGAARYRYRDHLAQGRSAARAVKLAVDAANGAMAKAGIRKRLDWNDTLLDRLPATAGNVQALRRLAAELPRLRAMPLRLDRLGKELNGVQGAVVRRQQRARVQARERLVQPPGGRGPAG